MKCKLSQWEVGDLVNAADPEGGLDMLGIILEVHDWQDNEDETDASDDIIGNCVKYRKLQMMFPGRGFIWYVMQSVHQKGEYHLILDDELSDVPWEMERVIPAKMHAQHTPKQRRKK